MSVGGQRYHISVLQYWTNIGDQSHISRWRWRQVTYPFVASGWRPQACRRLASHNPQMIMTFEDYVDSDIAQEAV
jgi:hypothetical protein